MLHQTQITQEEKKTAHLLMDRNGAGGYRNDAAPFRKGNYPSQRNSQSSFFQGRQQNNGISRNERQDTIADIVKTQRKLLRPDPEKKNELEDYLNNIGEAKKKFFSLSLPHCMSLVEENDVSFITTETGSGKSTVIPVALSEKYPKSMILITEPRRISAVQLATRVADLLGETLGEGVGYSVRGERKGVVGETRIMFVSSYSLLLYLLGKDPRSLPFDFIILDEFHERSVDIQVSAMLIRSLMSRSASISKKLKLLLCSATADEEGWVQYFQKEGLRVGQYSECAELHSVQEMDGKDVCALIGSTYLPIELSDEVSFRDRDAVLSRVYLMLDYLSSVLTNPTHSILVFLPGRADLEQAAKWIEENYALKYSCVIWHRETELSAIEEAVSRTSEVRNKVYLSTDIAEVSLTLPDAVFVIDSCLQKRNKIDFQKPDTLIFPPLKLFWESKASARQRRGRIGRVRSGVYMSMVSMEDRNRIFPATMSRRCTAEDLASIVLHCTFLSKHVSHILSLCCEPPDNRLVDYCVNNLLHGGLVTTKVKYAFHVTSNKNVYGRYLRQWEEVLDSPDASGPENEKHKNRFTLSCTLKGFITAHAPSNIAINGFLYYGCLFGQLNICAFLASICSVMHPFTAIYDHNMQIRKEFVKTVSVKMIERVRKLSSTESFFQNDILACASALLDYKCEVEDAHSEDKILEWCERNSIIRTRAVESLGIFEVLADRFSNLIPLTTEVNQEVLKDNVTLLHIISTAVGALHAVDVLYNEEEGRRSRYNGRGIFLQFLASKNESLPTTCSWAKDKVCISMNLSSGEQKCFGSMSLEVTQCQLFLSVLFTSSTVYHCPISENEIVFKVLLENFTKKPFHLTVKKPVCDYILLLRSMLCLKLAVIAEAISRGVTEEEASNSLESLSDKFQSSWIKNPNEIINRIPHLLVALFSGEAEASISRTLPTVIMSLEDKSWDLSALTQFNDGKSI